VFRRVGAPRALVAFDLPARPPGSGLAARGKRTCPHTKRMLVTAGLSVSVGATVGVAIAIAAAAAAVPVPVPEDA